MEHEWKVQQLVQWYYQLNTRTDRIYTELVINY